MTKHEFHNALRVLMSIDLWEVPFLSHDPWVRFSEDPFRFFIRCDDETCDRVWVVIESRTTKRAV